MNIREVEYSVSKDGHITNPGKFEGEMFGFQRLTTTV